MTDPSSEPTPEPAPTTRAGRVAIVGRPNVGKSTLLNALLGQSIAITSPHPQTTRDAIRGVLTIGDTQLVFVDTPGLHDARSRLGHHMNAAARDEAHEADVVVLVVEPQIAPADVALAKELGTGKTILVINKIDKVKAKHDLLPLLAQWGEVRPFSAIVPMSARKVGTKEGGADRLLRELAPLVPEQPFFFEEDTLSDQPMRFFVAEFVRGQILMHTRQEVPHGVAVVVERFDEAGKVPHIEVAIHVAREAHKGIVVGAQGQMLKSIGTAARARVEKLLGKHVHLKLWVRATPDWMNDPAKLREMGYGAGGKTREA